MPLEEERAAQLAAIEEEIRGLTDSPLYEYRTLNHYYPVIGEGSPTAEVVFIGEAPGEVEAKTGRPFVGPAGRMLDSMLADAGLSREDIYITNVVKDRPPDNRDPRVKEVRLYAPFLWRQMDIIQPKVIVPLGRHALEFVRRHFTGFPTEGSVSTLHGTAYPVDAPWGRVFIMPLYHPAVLFYREDLKEAMAADFRLLAELLANRQPADSAA
jgi:DNA polymerase